MLTTNLTGNLGNHMWQYAVCRTVAEGLIMIGVLTQHRHMIILMAKIKWNL